MFCPNCGSPNPETAPTCGTCGTSLQVSQPMAQAGGYPAPNNPYALAAPIPNYMGVNIALTVVGVLACLPLAIGGAIGIFFSSQVAPKAARGDIAGAQSSANAAKMTAIVTGALTALGVVVGLGFLFFAVASEM